MNIAIINNLYEPFARGGAEKIAKLQFEELKKQGHNVITISLRPYGQNIKDDYHYFLASIFPALNKIPKIFRLLWHLFDIINFINFFQIKKILRKNNIELVITHNLCGIGKIIIPHLSKYKHIHILHDIALLHPSGLLYYKKEFQLNSVFAKIYQKINIYFFKELRNVVSPSNWLLDTHKDKGFFKSINTQVIPNPIDLRKNFNQDQEKTNSNLIFLFVGLISEHKGANLLLDAWISLDSSRSKQAELFLAGEIYGIDIESYTKKTDNIRYLGRVDNEKINEIMKTSTCLIVPSICYENSPTVIYEAYASNLPVIASNLGGSAELIDKFGGITFAPEVEDLKKLISNIIDDPKILSLHPGSYESSSQDYSSANYISLLLKQIM